MYVSILLLLCPLCLTRQKANILVSSDFRPLVCHFGLSKLVEEATETSAQLTLTSEPNYSRYLAPELIRGDVSGPKMNTDVYSFGMAMLECLTLEKPFSNRKRVSAVSYNSQGDLTFTVI